MSKTTLHFFLMEEGPAVCRGSDPRLGMVAHETCSGEGRSEKDSLTIPRSRSKGPPVMGNPPHAWRTDVSTSPRQGDPRLQE